MTTAVIGATGTIGSNPLADRCLRCRVVTAEPS
jgi:hypothetical protein